MKAGLPSEKVSEGPRGDKNTGEGESAKVGLSRPSRATKRQGGRETSGRKSETVPPRRIFDRETSHNGGVDGKHSDFVL